jgi:hypothetical protein
MSQERKALDAIALAVMLIAADISLVMQAAIRSISATLVVRRRIRRPRHVACGQHSDEDRKGRGNYYPLGSRRCSVCCGVVFLSEPLSAAFGLAARLVAAGIVLVNLRS